MNKKVFDQHYKYKDRAPHFITKEELTEEQWNRLVNSDTFCMMPWVHMHAFPDGRVYPCCLSEYWLPIGDLRKNTMREIWNQDGYKKLRANMLNEKTTDMCNKCYEQEKHGAFSLRNDANRNYGHYINEVDQTSSDGTNPEFKIRHWDIRFSNLCNFRCRTCGPLFSSNWYNDHVKLYGKPPDIPLVRDLERIEYAGGDEDAMISQMEEHIPYLEQVYFAGGEPLIMKEHYYLLEKLIEHGKTDIRIQYNTNFSELAFKDKHVFEYWKHFKNVSVGASLDGMGPQAELIRKGTDWNQTLENRRRMIEEVPHVDFYIAATISSMNVLHVLDFHREWVNLNLIKAQDFNVNICQGPEWYRADIFPGWFKEEIIVPAYNNHIDWLEPQDKLNRATNGFKSILSFITENNGTQYWDRFVTEVEKLDNIRNENFWDTFTEFRKLKNG